jgi:RimJ/RimL family protein N-acetyltransferase
MTIIPTLTTERLILRAYLEDDAPALAAIHGDPQVSRFLGANGEPKASLVEAWDHIAMHLGHWALKGCGKWAVVEKASGQLVGRIGYFDAPYEWPGLELGWTLSRDVWGRGYATEGAHAALNWGFQTLATNEIISAIRPANHPSIRVAERLGERHLRDVALHNKPCLIYGITREEWQRQAATKG